MLVSAASSNDAGPERKLFRIPKKTRLMLCLRDKAAALPGRSHADAAHRKISLAAELLLQVEIYNQQEDQLPVLPLQA